MSYYTAQTPIRKIAPVISAGFALFLACALSISGLNAFGFYWGLGLLPLLVIAVWPRRANTVLSLLAIFLAGIFTDWAVGGIFGQSALVYTVIWGFLRPELRSSPYAPFGLFFVWLLTCLVALVLISVSGWFVSGVLPDLASLGRQIIIATLLLPIIVLLRLLIAKRIGDHEEWGG